MYALQELKIEISIIKCIWFHVDDRFTIYDVIQLMAANFKPKLFSLNPFE